MFLLARKHYLMRFCQPDQTATCRCAQDSSLIKTKDLRSPERSSEVFAFRQLKLQEVDRRSDHFPAFAIFFVDQLSSFRSIGGGQVGRIPVQRFAKAISNSSQQHGFGQRT